MTTEELHKILDDPTRTLTLGEAKDLIYALNIKNCSHVFMSESSRAVNSAWLFLLIESSVYLSFLF